MTRSRSNSLEVIEPAPEFTPRAVLVGLLIGCLLCFTNLYFGLQSGWISMMSLQSTLLGYLISLLFTKPMSPQENVILQTTAVATGTMPLAAGFVGIVPALGLLNPKDDDVLPFRLSWLNGISWSLAVAFFGVFLAAPLRKQVILKEGLPFPSGTATAHLISVLHRMPPLDTGLKRRKGYQAISDDIILPSDAQDTAESTALVSQTQNKGVNTRWAPLIWSFAASSGLTIAAYFFPVLFALPLFGTYLAREWAWSFSPSLSYVGQGQWYSLSQRNNDLNYLTGIIMGFPTTLSMNAGAVVGWALLSPISKANGWAPGPVLDMAEGSRGWILWVALAIMCADSLVSLLPVIYEVAARTFNMHTPLREDEEVESDDRLVPRRWVIFGIAASILIGTTLVWLVFGTEGIKPWATILGFFMGILLSILGVRALGETDLNPVSGLGKLSQLVFSILQPGNIVANIVAGGVAEAGASQAGDLMQDLKTGHLIRASPRCQFYGQIIGSTLSILVTTSAYSLYTRAYQIPGPEFPAPTAYVWLSLARLLRDGSLPPRSKEFMLAFGAIFGLASGLRTFGSRRQLSWSKWLPSGIAFAIGFLNTPPFSIARLIGGIAEYIYRRRMEGGSDIGLIIVASGLVLGEGVSSIVTLVLRTLGVGVASCIGCETGICAGCAG